MKKAICATFSVLVFSILSGCGPVNIKLFADAADPLREFVLEGEAKEKIAVISIRGLITDKPDEGFFGDSPSLVQEAVSLLNRVKRDGDVKAVVLRIDSLGGTVTASDVLYHEITSLKKSRDVKIVASLMDIATSGGYYIAMPADRIMAHPTTVTGSLGVILVRPDATGLMDKIGLRVNVNKSGRNKDMGSFFKKSTPEEEKILQQMVDEMGDRFIDLAAKHRGLKGEALEEAATARIFTAKQAVRIGLVDRTGYIQDAVAEAKKLSGAPDDARVVVYRRKKYPDDNYYNPLTMGGGGKNFTVFDTGLGNAAGILSPGFYYIWLQ